MVLEKIALGVSWMPDGMAGALYVLAALLLLDAAQGFQRQQKGRQHHLAHGVAFGGGFIMFWKR